MFQPVDKKIIFTISIIVGAIVGLSCLSGCSDEKVITTPDVSKVKISQTETGQAGSAADKSADVESTSSEQIREDNANTLVKLSQG